MVDEDALELTAAQARVLGALMEKERTTPDAYPLTLNALATACNQTTNRDPVVQYGQSQIETTILALKAKGLARIVHPGSGERSTRYRHVLDEALHLEPAELALLTVLFLRGPQTLNELKTRTERLHPFHDADDLERTLAAMAGRTPALVAPVDRAPGQREGRWIQLLEAGAEQRATAARTTTVTPSARGPVDTLEARVTALEKRVAALMDAVGYEEPTG